MSSTYASEPRYCPECGRPISIRAQRCVRCAAQRRAANRRRFPADPSPVPPWSIPWPALTERELRVIRRAPAETDWGALARHLQVSHAVLLAIRAELRRAPARPPLPAPQDGRGRDSGSRGTESGDPR